MKIVLGYPIFLTNKDHRDDLLESLASFNIADNIEVIKVGIINRDRDSLSSGLEKKFDKIITNPYNCVALAWNEILKFAYEVEKADYCIIGSMDTNFIKGSADALIKAAKQNKQALIVSGDLSEPTKKIKTYEDFKKIPHTTIKTDIKKTNYCCFLVKKELIKKVGYFDINYVPAYWEDIDMNYRLSCTKKYFGMTTFTAPFWHKGSRAVNNDNHLRNMMPLYFEQNKSYYIKKWGGDLGKEKFTTPFNQKNIVL